MSKFISVHDMLFGCRGGILGGPDDDFFFEAFPFEKPIAVTGVVCAIEMWTTYHYDDFGRFCVADDEAKEKIKAALAEYESEKVLRDPDEVEEHYSHIRLLKDPKVWIGIGWLKDDLPDFEACYQQWKAANGMDGVDAPPISPDRQAPSSQSHLWKLMNQLLKLVVGDETHQLIKKDDYKKAISTLESKGLRWAENEKKALRRHLKMIVTNAQH